MEEGLYQHDYFDFQWNLQQVVVVVVGLLPSQPQLRHLLFLEVEEAPVHAYQVSCCYCF